MNLNTSYGALREHGGGITYIPERKCTMVKINSQRNGCKDVFNAFMVNDASYSGIFEFPHIEGAHLVPNKLIPFSKAISSRDYNQWIHFYEDDYLFERIWRNPRRYLALVRKYNGVILPDFSIYRDMPFAMQIWNIYRSRAIGHWLQGNGINIIPNIRYGDRRTYRVCCNGIEPHSVVALGSHGNLKNPEDRKNFWDGFDYIVKALEPASVIIYGAAPNKYLKKYRESGISIICFASLYAASHNKEVV